MSHHDGWIQGGEIKCGNRNAVIPTQRRRWWWKGTFEACTYQKPSTPRAESHTLTQTADVHTLSLAQSQLLQCNLLLLLFLQQAWPGLVSWPKHEQTLSVSILKSVRMHALAVSSVCLCYLSEQLRDDFDLLPSWEQVGERHTCHSGHLHVVNHTHQLLQQAQREVGVFQAVDGQTSTCLFVAILWWRKTGETIDDQKNEMLVAHIIFFRCEKNDIQLLNLAIWVCRALNDIQLASRWNKVTVFVLYLQISDDGVLHIFFLFLQEVVTHSVQCVWAQFIVPEENLRETHQSDCTPCVLSFP